MRHIEIEDNILSTWDKAELFLRFINNTNKASERKVPPLRCCITHLADYLYMLV